MVERAKGRQGGTCQRKQVLIRTNKDAQTGGKRKIEIPWEDDRGGLAKSLKRVDPIGGAGLQKLVTKKKMAGRDEVNMGEKWANEFVIGPTNVPRACEKSTKQVPIRTQPRKVSSATMRGQSPTKNTKERRSAKS